MDIWDKLNDRQKEAVTTTEGYVRVIAGAGSGKTRALSYRFAYLVEELGILPGHILCVTFTNKSAREMARRIHQLTGDDDTGYINTFHGFCVSVLQEDSHAVSYPKNFLVIDNSDIDDMLQMIYEEMGLTLRDMPFNKARDMIEMKKCVWQPDYYKDMIAMPLSVLYEKYHKALTVEDVIFYGYLYQEKKCFALDYNDLIKFTLYIFEQNEEIRLKWQKRLEYIMIDEFQDIDPLQYKLMKVLCGYHHNLFVVGDPDQTIYTWRGADIRYLLHFHREFPKVKTIFMNDNYRSTPEILDAANSLIDKNEARMKKDLISHQEKGPAVTCFPCANAGEEAKRISEEIKKLHEAGTPYGDISLLYRAHYVTRNLEEALLKAKVPYTIYSGTQFFDRMEIKDALCYLRMIAYKDDMAFRRIVNQPKRNIGRTRMEFLQQKAKEENLSLYETLQKYIDDPVFKRTKAGDFIELIEYFTKDSVGRQVSEVLSAILDESGYEKMLRTEGSQERLDNLAELKQSIFEYETTAGEETSISDYLEHAALFSNMDRSPGEDRVKLMTIHTAKGLEFPVVFLCAMNEGIFPSRRTKTKRAMEEERRLAFVALTRAQKRLYLTEAEGTNLDGTPRFPSRFIMDIDRKYLSFDPAINESLYKAGKAYVDRTAQYLKDDEAPSHFEKGTRVRHPVFGPGTIENVDESGNSYSIRFDNMNTTRDIAFRARLSKL
ncbi:ATP-dependent helicase [Dialister sp.]|uniref:ATP-dependent helicase n=1 Tax=Dialister sp. TaxID=1955814 RepID=UPI002E8089E5|nr:3'-5' exonuclease [Dialister sp.]MEE3453203.1 3'-5' exonuclease [Dialister sp.]